MATVKKPPKAPAKAGVTTPPAVVTDQATKPVVVPDDMPSTDANALYGESYGTDWVYAGKPSTDPAAGDAAKVDQALAAEVKAPKVDKHKADVDTALDRLGKIESLAIRWGGDHGQEIRQLACEAMVALGFK